MKQLMSEVAELRNSYDRELAGLGIETMLDATTFESGPSIPQRLSNLAQAQGVVEKYRLRTRQAMDSARTRIQALDLPDGPKREMLEGFDKTQAKSRQLVERLWDLEKAIIGEAVAVLRILQESDGWEIRGSQVLFSDTRTADAYNWHIGELQRFAQEEANIHAQAQADMKRNLDKAQAGLD